MHDEAGLHDAVDNQAAEALLEDALNISSVPHMRASLLAARESFIYGIGDYRTSDSVRSDSDSPLDASLRARYSN